MPDYSVILIALLLDLMLGDPRWLPHPVRWMGWCITKFESYVRSKRCPLKMAGVLLAVGLPACVWLLAFITLSVAGYFSSFLRGMLEIWLVYQCVSVRGLIDETRKVYNALQTEEIEQARQHLSMIVGRDTDHLNGSEIARATVETIAEGSVDGVSSPIFWAAIGGAPLAMAFKAVSTLDSMVGYKNERYEDFGWASAKLDDIANWIPARLSIIIIPIAALFTGQNARRSFRVGIRDRLKHSSPNAGHAEAAYAGAFNVQLGGPSTYQGHVSNKPILNSNGYSVQQDHIIRAWKLLFVSSMILILFYSILCYLNLIFL